MIRIELEGLPISANKERGKVRAAIRRRSAYKRDVWVQVHEAGLTGLSLGSKAAPLRVEIVYVLGPKSRNRDTLSNMEKTLLDALQSAGVIKDDRWVKMGEVASIPGPADRTLVKIFQTQALTAEQLEAWWEASSPNMEVS